MATVHSSHGHITVPESIAPLVRSRASLPGAETLANSDLQTPIGTAVVSTTPTFTWDNATADAYAIAIFDVNFSEVARASVNTTFWRGRRSQARRDLCAAGDAHRGTTGTEASPRRPEARFTMSTIGTLRARAT